MVQRFLRSKGLDIDAAADLAQDAFVKLWQNCDKVPEAKAQSFLLTTANNLVIDSYRKSKTKLRYMAADMGQPMVEDPAYQLLEAEFKHKLERAMEAMTDGCREVFVLSRIEDMKYREIAEALGLSVKAVEKRMSKAIKHLVDHDIIQRK